MRVSMVRSEAIRETVGVRKYGVSLGRGGALGCEVAEGVGGAGVVGAVSVRAETGVLCLLDERRSRGATLPVPFFEAGGIL